MKKTLLIYVISTISFAYGMGTDNATAKTDELLYKWGIHSNAFIKQENVPTHTTLIQNGNDNDEDDPIGIVTFAAKYPNIFSACCGGKQSVYLEVLAIAPHERRKGIAKKLVTQVIEIAQKAADIDRVVALIPRGNTAAEKLYLQMGFIQESTPDWAPQQFNYLVD